MPLPLPKPAYVHLTLMSLKWSECYTPETKIYRTCCAVVHHAWLMLLLNYALLLQLRWLTIGTD